MTHNWHAEISKFGPEIFDGVKTDESSDELSDPFHTAHTANRPSCEDEPDPPVITKGAAIRMRFRWNLLVTLIAEFDETQCGSKGEEEQHGVQQDEPRDTQPSDV